MTDIRVQLVMKVLLFHLNLGKLEKPENKKITTLCVKVRIVQIRDYPILQIGKTSFNIKSPK